MEYLYLFLAFMAGYVIRGLLANLYLIGRMSDFTKKVANQTQLFLSTVVQDIEFIKMAKYEVLNDSGCDKNLIIRERNMDEYTFNKWKQTVVKTYIDNYPAEFRKHHIKFDNWNQMVEQFNAKQSRDV